MTKEILLMMVVEWLLAKVSIKHWVNNYKLMRNWTLLLSREMTTNIKCLPTRTKVATMMTTKMMSKTYPSSCRMSPPSIETPGWLGMKVSRSNCTMEGLALIATASHLKTILDIKTVHPLSRQGLISNLERKHVIFDDGIKITSDWNMRSDMRKSRFTQSCILLY